MNFVKKSSSTRTYSQNLRLRREGLFGSAGEPIPGMRTAATLTRKERSRAARAARKQREAATALTRSANMNSLAALS